MDFSTQVNTFLLTAVTGILLGVLFDVYQVLRGVFRPPWFITAITDLVYWLVAVGLAFAALVLGNWGELRFYVFIALFAGGVLYYRLASRYITRFIIACLMFAARLWRWFVMAIVFTIVRPVRFGTKIALLPFRYMRRRSGRWYRKWRPPPPPPPPEEVPPS